MIACICGGVVEGCLLCTFLASMFGMLFKKHKHDCKCCQPKNVKEGSENKSLGQDDDKKISQ